jgi:hypothetical protein
MLRFLDVESRLTAARCNKQLLAAASQPFAWPQDQVVTFRVPTDDELPCVNYWIRRSLLRLAPLGLDVQVRDFKLLSEIFTVPNVRALKLHLVSAPNQFRLPQPGVLLPLLSHPAAQQLRSLDIFWFLNYRCSAIEALAIGTLYHLDSLTVGNALGGCELLVALPQLAHSLTHLSFTVPALHYRGGEQDMYDVLSRCTRLTSLHVRSADIDAGFVNGLTQLPLLQRLKLQAGIVTEQTGDAWTALRSLREIHFDHVSRASGLMPMMSSVPALHCSCSDDGAVLRATWRISSVCRHWTRCVH